jgi:hypothetical protein
MGKKAKQQELQSSLKITQNRFPIEISTGLFWRLLQRRQFYNFLQQHQISVFPVLIS